jgi:hypothetical protein
LGVSNNLFKNNPGSVLLGMWGRKKPMSQGLKPRIVASRDVRAEARTYLRSKNNGTGIASARVFRQILKGKDGLAKGTGSDWPPHPVGGGEIDFAAEEVGEAALESSYGDEGNASGAIEVGEQIDIGVRVCFAARDRSEETQMDEPSGPQLRGVRAQNRQDAFFVHE